MMLDPIQLAQRASRKLRGHAQRSRHLALARCRYEAHLRGLSLDVRKSDNVAVVKSGSRQIWCNATQTFSVWESIRYFDGIFGLVHPQRIDGCDVIDVSKPGEHTMFLSGDLYLFTAMPECEATTQLYLDVAQLAHGDIAIDGGAYCGHSTAALSHAVGPTGRVIALEPDPRNYAALCENADRHCLPNVTLLREGLWSESGELEFVAGFGMLSSVVLPGVKPSVPTSRIRVRSVEQLMLDLQIERVDFIKLDVEGAERAVLESMVGVIRRFRPRIVVEAITQDGRLTTPVLSRLLTAEGYDIRVVMEFWEADYQMVCATPRKPC